MHRDDTPDRPTSIDSEPNDTPLSRPLTAQERSRSEAKTWNWNAVKIYRGGQGPGVPFSEFAQSRAADAAERAAETTSGPGAGDDTPPASSEA